jgi:protein required for attachment to host cells
MREDENEKGEWILVADSAHARNRFRELMLIADPRFLGLLRGKLSAAVEGAVTGSIDKRALQMSPHELGELVASRP